MASRGSASVEKMLSITNGNANITKGNANQNHKEISPHTSLDGMPINNKPTSKGQEGFARI